MGFHQVLFLRLDFVLFIDIADKLHTSEECLEILMRSPPPGESPNVSVKLRMRFLGIYKKQVFCDENLKVLVILKIYSISCHTVYLMLC